VKRAGGWFLGNPRPDYFFSSFFSSAAGAGDEGAALEDEDELSDDDGAVLEAPLEGEVAGALEAGGVLLLEGLAGALLGLSRPQAVSANAAATAMSSALFIQVPLIGLGGNYDSPLF
jgi:hypothetical protein